MSKVFDILEISLKLILTDSTRIINSLFMENIFIYVKNILLPFAKFLEYKYKN